MIDDTQYVPRVSRTPSATDSPCPYVQVLSGKRAGYVHRLDDFELVLGRGQDCQLLLDEPGVSRRHAQISSDAPGEHWLTDLGSVNGTYLGEEAIEKVRLRDGDRFEVGSTTLKFGLSSMVELELAEKLYDSATRDGLTRALNRTSFFERLEQEISDCRRHGRSLGLVMLDVDHFKKINDSYGHPAGDFVLQSLADTLRKHTRLEDVLGRYGGEEFCLLLRQTAHSSSVEETAERLRRAVEQSHPSLESEGLSLLVTISLGAATLLPDETIAELLARADGALYRAKQGGRNRVEVAV